MKQNTKVFCMYDAQFNELPIDSGNRTTSAAKALGWAAKWIFAVEGWLAGEIGDEVFEHTY